MRFSPILGAEGGMYVSATTLAFFSLYEFMKITPVALLLSRFSAKMMPVKASSLVLK